MYKDEFVHQLQICSRKRTRFYEIQIIITLYFRKESIWDQDNIESDAYKVDDCDNGQGQRMVKITAEKGGKA